MSLTKKRLLAGLLCAVMALGLCLPVGAAPAMLGDDYTVAEIPVDDGGQVLEVRTSSVERPSVDTGDEQASLLDAAGFLNAVGQKESAYATWAPAAGVSRYTASIIDSTGKETTLDDALIRSYPGYMRVDALGLKAGKYKIKVTPNTGAAMTTEELTVTSYDRSGYAFEGGHTPGAYNKDGTLKPNTKVVYITQDTASTVKLGVDVNGKGTDTEVTGLPGILLAYKKKKETDPLCIRIIGTVANDYKGNLPGRTGTVITGTSHDGSSTNLNDTNFKGDLTVKDCMAPVTIEGVGNDAVLYGIGLRFMNANDLEVRNLGFMNCNSDEADSIGFQPSCNYVWVHNTDIFYGMKAGDADQSKGDGALDTKGVKYATLSYNHFWDAGKANLCGLDDNMGYMTYHHNWYDHSDSRHPRVRYTANCHVYNNYYDDNAKYGVGSTTGSSIFVENNYFRNCPKPMLISMQGSDINNSENKGTFSSENGGMIKAYGNIILGADKWAPYSASNTVEFDAYVTENKNDPVPAAVKTKQGGTSYNNFDTASGFYTYKLDKADDVPTIVKAEAGRQGGSDFDYQIADGSDVYAGKHIQPIAELASKINSYESSLVKVGGAVDGSGGGEHTHVTAWKVTTTPSCNASTQALVPGVETEYCTICNENTGRTREVPGQHTNDGAGKCSVCGADLSSGGSGGGTVTPSNPGKVLNYADFKDGATATTINDKLPSLYDGYFSLYGNVDKVLRKASSSKTDAAIDCISLERPKDSTDPVAGGIQFSVSDVPATVTAKASSAGDSKNSTMAIYKLDGETLSLVDGTTTTTSGNVKAAKDYTFELTSAGTYVVATVPTSANPVRLVTLTVSEKVSETPVAVTGVSLNKTTAEVKVGGTVTLTATVAPSNATNKAVTWTSSDTTVATVANGVVTGKKVGNATITVKTTDGNKTATCAVTVAAGAVEPEKVDKAALEAAIADAYAAKKGVVVSNDGKDVDKSVYWVTSTKLSHLNEAIEHAEAVATNAATTQDEVNSAVSAIKAAVDVFKAAKALGTKAPAAAGDSKVYTLEADKVQSASPLPTGWTATKGTNFSVPAAAFSGVGTEGFFTIYPKNSGSSGSKFDSGKTFTSDNYKQTYSFSFGGNMTLGETELAPANAIAFTATGKVAVKVWWIGGGSGSRQMVLMKDDKSTVATSAETASDSTAYISTLQEFTANGGTYYLGPTGGSNKVCKVEVTVTATSGETPVVIDKAALLKAMDDAAAAKKGVVTSADGKDVDKTIYWVTAAQLKTLNEAITAAEAVATAASTTQTAVDNAAKTLNDAVTAFAGQKALGTKEDSPVTPPTTQLDFSGLEATIAAAKQFQSVKVDTAAANVDKGVSWVTKDVMDALKAAITTAEGAKTSAKTQADVTAASAKLNAAVETFKSKISTGTKDTGAATVDKSELDKAIAAAQAELKKPTVSQDGTDVEPTAKWVTQAEHNTFKAAITTAEAAKLTAATAGDVTKAVKALTDAQSAFVKAQKAGIKGQKVAVTGVSLNKSSASVTVGKTLTLTATVKPSTATNKGVYWTSSDTSIVTVDQTGKLTGVKAGSAKVTVETLEGKFTATCTVTVSTAGGGGGGGGGGGSHGGGGGGGAAPAPAGMPFVDVAANAWYHDSVKKVYEKGLMKGTDATHFTPDMNTSRAMVATVLFRLDGEKATNVKELFNDVADGSWYSQAVAWAAAKGVVKGYDEHTFAPDDNVTREQLAVMLYRYAAPAAKSEKDLSAFADAASVSDWALEAITWAVDKGIMNGKGNGLLDPQGLASRAEICTMLVRFIEMKK